MTGSQGLPPPRWQPGALPRGRVVLRGDDLRVEAVNDAFLAPTGARPAELVGTLLLDGVAGRIPASTGEARTASEAVFERTLSTRQTGAIVVRHRIAAPGVGGPTLVDRSWVTLAAYAEGEDGPVLDLYSEDITHAHRLAGLLLEQVQDPGTPVRTGAEREASLEDAVSEVLALERSTREAQVAAAQLQEAMRSRAVIEQAKGILMAEHHYDEETAFAELRLLSNVHNVKVREVAAALVYGRSRGALGVTASPR